MNNQTDEKDLVIGQLSTNSGSEIGRLLQQNARLTVLASQLQAEVKQLKDKYEPETN